MKNLIFTGDWHLTDKASSLVVSRAIPAHSHLILMGDLIDAGIDRGMNWDQSNLTEQIETLQKVLSRYVIEAYVLGNHELRIKKKIGLNPYQSFLGNEIPECGIDERTICIEHGTKVVQNPLTQLRSMAEIHENADIVALGHDHTLGVWTYRNDYQQRNRWMVRTGNLMNGYADYARRAILKPQISGYIKYNLKKNYPEIVIV